MGSPIFEARPEHAEGGVAVTLRGELDIQTVPILKDVLAGIPKQTPSIVLDMRDLAFIDSSGLSVLLQAWKAANADGRRLSLVGVAGHTLRLLQITRTEFLLQEDVGVAIG